MNKIVLIIILFSIFIGISAQPIKLPQKQEHIFSNLEDEYKLVSYFLNSEQKRYFKTLNIEHKWHYLSTFWKVQDIDPTTDHNEFQQEIIVRIEYSNKHFSHFKNGWETDMGKTYIRYGEPFEILEFTNTGKYVRFALREYQIWKYRISIFQTFLFIDPQQHRDFRLVFSDGDVQYGSWEEWKKYLGTDFDAKHLQ